MDKRSAEHDLNEEETEYEEEGNMISYPPVDLDEEGDNYDGEETETYEDD